jgi:hypothetical protein
MNTSGMVLLLQLSGQFREAPLPPSFQTFLKVFQRGDYPEGAWVRRRRCVPKMVTGTADAVVTPWLPLPVTSPLFIQTTTRRGAPQPPLGGLDVRAMSSRLRNG